MSRKEQTHSRIVFWRGLLNPVFLCWVWGGLSALLRLCRYGAVRSSVLQGALYLLACALWAVIWPRLFRRVRRWLMGKYSTQWVAALLAEVVALSAMVSIAGYRTWQYAHDLTTRLGWHLYETANTVTFSLSHDNLYTDGGGALLEELRDKLELPDDVYVSNLFQIDFTADGTVSGMYAFLYGRDEEEELRSWLIEYSAEEETVTVWLDNVVTASFDEGQLLQPMAELLDALDLQAQAEALGGEELTLRYYGLRSDYPVEDTMYLVHEDGTLLQITASYTGYELLLTSADSDGGGRIYFASWLDGPEDTEDGAETP
ncbi:MAG: hypothetical protein LUF81_07490 [Clostridiales bacterium]|nr:hypothetical protein [Clostridiales bacterium]